MQFTKALNYTIAWKAINTILTFFINLFLVRIMGAGGSGEFFYAITLLSFFTLVISWSMEAGITYYGSKHQDSIPFITLLIIPWLIVQAFVSWILLDRLPIHINKNMSLLFVFSNLVIIYFSALYYAKQLFVAINRMVCMVNFFVLIGLAWVYFSKINNWSFFNNFLKEKIYPGTLLPGNVTLSINHPENAYLGGMVYFIGFTLQAMVLAIVFFTRETFKITATSHPPKLVRSIFLYSSIALISNILFFLVTRIDYYFVQKYCSEIALSNYVQVSKMGQLLVLLPTIIAGVIFPFSAVMDDKNYLDKLQTICRIIGLLIIAVAFIILLTGYWIFPWVFGTGFTLMYPAMLLYLPGFYSLSLVTLLAAHLAGKGMLTKNLAASAITLILVITGDILFIPVGGVYAAAAASSVAYLFCLIYLLLVYNKKWSCKLSSFIVCRESDLALLGKKFPRLTFLK